MKILMLHGINHDMFGKRDPKQYGTITLDEINAQLQALGLQLGASWLVWGVYVRTVLVWHITWSVNSLTHLFGYRTYATDEDSRNNWLVAVLANGEGWHNNHHHDPASASVQHKWWEFDATYCMILVLEKLGLATDVIKPRHLRKAVAAEARRMAAEPSGSSIG
jgi:fatty-acid desaturase